MENGNELFAKRLKTLRVAQGFSQKQLGVLAGIDEFVASARINRYEQAVHRADFAITNRIAKCLNAPASYFYTEDEKIADLLLIYYRTTIKNKKSILKFIKELCDSTN